MKFSANLGFLWTELTLPDAIRAAKSAGFDAVECHWPYDVATSDIIDVLGETGLKMLGINACRGNSEAGENGLGAVIGREAEAKLAISEAVEYGAAIGTQAVHVMAGFTQDAGAHETFIQNLRFACKKAAPHDISILIEPLNRFDAPEYFLNSTEQARKIIKEVGAENLKMMFDCYHTGRTEGDVINQLKQCLPVIGHIQFASVPDRGAPDHGEVDYRDVFAEIAASGWQKPLGAEYRPNGSTEASLSWLADFR